MSKFPGGNLVEELIPRYIKSEERNNSTIAVASSPSGRGGGGGCLCPETGGSQVSLLY